MHTTNRLFQALLVPALSGGGKSTLSRAAHEAGATVLSDEYALIEPTTGLVTGWNRPVRILTEDDGVDRLDIAVRSEPLPIGCIAFVTHRDGFADEWEDLSRGVATGRLLTHTICATSRPDESFEAALAATATARLIAGTRGEATEAIDRLMALTLPG